MICFGTNRSSGFQKAEFMLARASTVLALALMLTGCASRIDPSWTPTPAEARLAELTTARLTLAREVAWIKFRNGLPVLDRERESESLTKVVALGVGQGLNANDVQQFFEAQMTASRVYQSYLISRWKDGGALPLLPPRDLVSGIRPEIDDLNRELLAQLALTGPRGGNPELAAFARNRMEQQNIPRSAIAASTRVLK
jgi:chorismate mutase